MATTKASKATKADKATVNNEQPQYEETPETPETTLQTQGSTALEEYEDYGDDAGVGYENQDNSDRKIPMLVILQSNSPQVTQRQAQAGQIYNTVTKQAFDAVDIVPAITDHVFTEWCPRDPKTGASTGGFKGRHAKNSAIVAAGVKANGGRVFGKLPVKQIDAKGQQLVDKDGEVIKDTELVETFEIASIVTQGYVLPAGLNYDPKNGPPVDKLAPTFDASEPQGPALIACTSTKIKAYREWNTDIGMFQVSIKAPDGSVRKQRVPLFAHHVRMITKLEEKNGRAYYVPAFVPVNGSIKASTLRKTDARYLAAKLLHEQYSKGVVTGAYETDSEANASGGGGEADGEKASPF